MVISEVMLYSDILSQLSGGNSVSSSRSLMGLLNWADFLKGAFGVCMAVKPCDTEQHENNVKP